MTLTILALIVLAMFMIVGLWLTWKIAHMNGHDED